MKPTAVQLIALRKSMAEFVDLDDACWHEVASHFYVKKLAKNEFFSLQGQMIKDVGFVEKGIMRIFYFNKNGEEWNKHFLQHGDFVAAGISPQCKSITNIQTLHNATLLCIPYFELERLSLKYMAIKVFVQNVTSSYLEQKQHREISLLSEEAATKYFNFKKQFPLLEDKIQHYHIASYLGITPTQLSRLRKKTGSPSTNVNGITIF